MSIQAQVVNLLQDLQKEQGLTYLFIAHDLSMVKHISDRIGVMHSGKLLEMGTSDDVYNFGVHPYTESLLSAIPLPDPDYERTRKRIVYQPARQMEKIVSSVKFSMDTMFIVLKTKLQCTVKKLKRRKEKLVYNQLLF